MSYDLLIRDGTLIDGTGAPPRRADVGVRNGHIMDVGDLRGAASVRLLDADGAVVCPGFVDLHTHYDGQLSWDPDLLPSSAHGVTTVVAGNCGVGFAPCRVEDREALIALMEGVEDIPGSALSEGIRWSWETFSAYMDALDAAPHTLDFALQVPHDCLRVWAMGERGLRGEVATEADILAMREELRRALEAGAAGFTTGRSDNHRARSGAATPASEASARELMGIARAFDGLDHGVIQVVSDFDLARGPEHFDQEFDLIDQLALAAPGRPLSISLSQRDQEPAQWRRILARAEAAEAAGRRTRLQVAPRGIGVILGLQATFHPFIGHPTYRRLAHLPLPERVAALRDPETRQRLLTEPIGRVSGEGSSIPPLVDLLLSMIDRISFRMFRLGQSPVYEPSGMDSLGAAAWTRGVTPLEAILDALLEDEGRALLYFPIFNYSEFNLDNVREMMTHPQALPGLSDGGAHVGTICDASFSTFLLTHWTRDRPEGRLPLAWAVRQMSGETAQHIGLHDRGVIRPGLRADLNVIDIDTLSLRAPRMVQDLPAGGCRLLQDAQGYRATVVAGRVILENDQLTGERPGRLARVGVRSR